MNWTERFPRSAQPSFAETGTRWMMLAVTTPDILEDAKALISTWAKKK